MKTRIQCLVLAASVLILTPLRAQVVNDGTTNTLSNVTTNFIGDVTVGTNGSFTLLILSDNALLTNSVNGLIGHNAMAKSNEVQLLSASARWRMGGSLFVGSNGAASRLLVSNGALLENNNGTFGNRLGSSNNFAFVTDGGSIWSNRSDLTVGFSGHDNQLIVSNGGWVTDHYGYVGRQPGSSNNFVLVTGSGSVWSNQFDMYVGFNERSNRLVVEAGGLAHCDNGYVGDFGSASNNEALVTGPGSLWTNRSYLTIGSQAGRNRLVVSNGAALRSGTGVMGGSSAVSNQLVVTGAGSLWSNETFLYLGAGSVGDRADVNDGGWLACNDGYVGSGFTANSNTVVLTDSGSGWNNLGGLIVGDGGSGNVLIASNGATVLSSNGFIGASTSLGNNNFALLTGAGTLWSNRNNLVVGNFSFGNRLQVDNGATVSSSNVFVGFNNSAGSNRIALNGGTLRATSLLDIRRGTNVLDAGLVEADRLLLTNAAGRFEFNGGTLITRGAFISNSVPFTVGRSGTNPAVWDVRAGLSNHQLANRLIVGSNASFNQVFITNGAILNSPDYTFLAFSSGSNNAVTVSGPGSTLHSSFGFFVGADGNANRMFIGNGGEVIASLGNSGTFIGRSTGTRSNAVTVTDPGSRWSVNDSLSVGAGGNANQLVVSNGAAVDSLIGNVGSSSSASNNLVIVTGANSSWSNRSELTVGAVGSGNRLVVSDGGMVINSNATLGLGQSGRGNVVLVSGAGALWNNRSDLLVGRDGRNNQLIVSDGGTVISGNGFLGFSGFGGSNTALVTDAGSLWTNRLDLHVGRECTFNVMVVSNQAQVVSRSGSVGFGIAGADNGAVVTGEGSAWNNSQDLIIGNDNTTANDNWLLLTNGGSAFAASNGIIGLGTGTFFNQAIVTDPFSRWALGRDLYVGSNGALSKLIVTNGGVVSNRSGFVGGNASSLDNLAQVTGAGSFWDNQSNLLVGFSGSRNLLTVDNGGRVVSSNAFIGFNASSSNNSVVVAGTGSSWINSSDLYVGGGGQGNRLIVTNGGVVTNGTGVIVGDTSLSTGNRVVVDGGTLSATNSFGTGTLDVRRGTNVLDAGLIETDQFRLTNVQGSFEFNGGTLSAKDITFNNGQVFRVGNGVNPATLLLAGNGSHAFSSSGVSVSANGTLTGNGTASGALVVQAGGRLSPGTPIGRIFLTRIVSPLLQGTTLMEISKNGPILTNDLLQVTVSLVYGGSLTVSNLGSDALAVGDRFRLFVASAYSGSFSNLSLPALSPGLGWSNRLAVDGSIEVVGVTQPKFSSITVSGTNVVISGSGGPTNASYTVLTATDVAQPSSNWVSVATNQFGAGGEFSLTNGVAPGEPQRYFRIRTP